MFQPHDQQLQDYRALPAEKRPGAGVEGLFRCPGRVHDRRSHPKPPQADAGFASCRMRRGTLMPNIYAALMRPSNILCDWLQVSGEAERGVVRMLINTLFWTTLGVILVWWVS